MNLRERAKTLRKHQTEAEQRLWYFLRAHRFMNLKFKRQEPIGSYIVDFVCHTHQLIIEADGGQHAENMAYDQTRDAWLAAQGFTMMRFWNNEILQQTDAVLEKIRLAVEGFALSSAAALSPAPLPKGEGEQQQV
ncbi:MAG: endonuclease domain-containing protein [Proteobacteria bacterium]|nr:endonuclease domain-containing protein [Pseudomonadota bacterium]